MPIGLMHPGQQLSGVAMVGARPSQEMMTLTTRAAQAHGANADMQAQCCHAESWLQAV